MNINGLSYPAFRSRGITLVEVLLVISLLVILLSFAMPSVGNATARAELRATHENVEYSISAARNVARMNESAVQLSIETSPDQRVQKITFASPPDSGRSGATGPALQEYRLPEGIRLLADREQYVFDPYGLLSHPGRLMLVSTADDDVTSTIEID